MKDLQNLKMPEVIDEINRLAKIKKERALTEEENAYREELKILYLKYFRAGFEQQLQNTKVIDPEGNDVTPKKLKKQGESHD
ncbi:DUF896 domain-containing protein [Mesoplasma melaleucae]|uniref:DUF896 family protein n=1 Tax=Mesoplasma melaleucae TaxID=81459 RepID=A0A2K8NW24_9MOLU|nr:DUF896 domain-containing protein [Mesoplasma melaleucae]ATZ18030.1 hypothetical protein EMELA_v1c04900 [Mesoplasma melaleucae]